MSLPTMLYDGIGLGEALQYLLPPESRPPVFDDMPAGDLGPIVAPTPLGQRVQTLRAMVEDDVVEAAVIGRRLTRVTDDRDLELDHRRNLARMTMEAACISGHLLASRDRTGAQVLLPGPRCWPDRLHKDIDITHRALAVDLGASLLFADPLTLWEEPSPDLCVADLPYSFMQAVLLHGHLDVEEASAAISEYLIDETSAGHGHEVDRFLWLTLEILGDDLGWIEMVQDRDVELPVVRTTSLGLIGFTVAMSKAQPDLVAEPIADLAAAHGYLRVPGGFIDPDDLPSPVSMN